MSIESNKIPAPVASALHVRGAADLVQVVPYLLGFRPQNSVVVVGLDRSHVVVTVRIDIADATNKPLVTHALRAMATGGANTVVGVIYSDAPHRLDYIDRVVEVVQAAARRRRLEVLDVLAVQGDTWRSLVCEDPAHCLGSSGYLNGDDSEVAAAATFAGLAVLPSRDALVATLDRLPAEQLDRVAALLPAHEDAIVQATVDASIKRHEGSVKRAIFAAARAADDGADSVDDDAVARFVVALGLVTVRDPVWLAIDDGRLDGEMLWTDLVRRAPPPYDAAPAFLLAWHAWRAGRGALASTAAQRAVESDPDYGAAKLLMQALSAGLDPRRVPRLGRP